MQRVSSVIMRDTTNLLGSLRKLMKSPPGLNTPLSAYIVPSDDAHQSEYICKRDERRAFISGFDGSAGTVVVSMNEALLWTDGRYYQQALKQLDKNWTLMKDGLTITPSIGSWLTKILPKGSKVGVDPKLISNRAWTPIQTELQGNDCELIAVEKNLIDHIWENQPESPKNSVITLDLKFSGETIKTKWDNVCKEMLGKKCETLIVSALDEIAWFLNLRGTDIEYNPVFFSYLIINQKEINLFIDSEKLPKNLVDHEKQNNVKITLQPYDSIKSFIEKAAENVEGKVWVSPTSSQYLMSLIPRKKLHQEITPIAEMKAIKNSTEIKGFIDSHIRDGAALCQYFAWLENALKNGEYVDEISGATKLEQLRSKNEHYMGLSFTTISSSGPNGSVIHYHPSEETNRQISEKEVYLCDSGAQYLDGTTDVTRTFHFGNPTDFQKEAYSRVLKGQLTLGSTIFPKKVKGQVLDTLARKALWDIGLDYGHGTAHGIGHFLNVHEGPQGVGIRLMPDDPGLQENMFLSNEPGFYKDGEFGIRIEDIVQIVPATNVKYDFSGRGALTFKTITLCPKQTKLIKKDLLSEVEIQMLNNYHKQVADTLRPILERENDILTLKWLEKETQPI